MMSFFYIAVKKVRWSKTIQKGEKILELPLLEIKQYVLYPFAAYRNRCRVVLTSRNSPLVLLDNGRVID